MHNIFPEIMCDLAGGVRFHPSDSIFLSPFSAQKTPESAFVRRDVFKSSGNHDFKAVVSNFTIVYSTRVDTSITAYAS